MRRALERLNPTVPAEALEEAFRKLTRPDSPSLVASNHIVHKYLVEGVTVEYQRTDGSIGGDLVRVIDSTTPTTTTGSRSTSSRSSRASTTAGRMSCSSSTACRWR